MLLNSERTSEANAPNALSSDPAVLAPVLKEEESLGADEFGSDEPDDGGLDGLRPDPGKSWGGVGLQPLVSEET